MNVLECCETIEEIHRIRRLVSTVYTTHSLGVDITACMWMLEVHGFREFNHMPMKTVVALQQHSRCSLIDVPSFVSPKFSPSRRAKHCK